MNQLRSVLNSFLIGGCFALVAQTIAAVWAAVLPGTFLEFFIGGATLVSMGVIGCLLAGTGVYQRIEKWGTFGALMPFSGFAMAVGMKMIRPWCDGATASQAIWKGTWLVIWFNLLGLVTCVAFGWLCGMSGVHPVVAPKNEAALLFPGAFVAGGAIAALFQSIFLAARAVSPKVKPLWILVFGWMAGALCAPSGLSGSLINQFGQGFAVMVPVGGNNMFNVGMDFARGETTAALVHLGSFGLTVGGLFLYGLATFYMYRSLYGRTPIEEVHLSQARQAVVRLAAGMPSMAVPGMKDEAAPDLTPSGALSGGGAAE